MGWRSAVRAGSYIIPLEGMDTYRFAMDYTMTLADAG